MKNLSEVQKHKIGAFSGRSFSPLIIKRVFASNEVIFQLAASFETFEFSFCTLI
jgi:hypothetical protein